MRTCTAQQLADYFSKHVMLGLGQWVVRLDPRDGDGYVVTPPAGAQFDEEHHAVFAALRKETQ